LLPQRLLPQPIRHGRVGPERPGPREPLACSAQAQLVRGTGAEVAGTSARRQARLNASIVSSPAGIEPLKRNG
jgi:hypothetical protein